MKIYASLNEATPLETPLPPCSQWSDNIPGELFVEEASQQILHIHGFCPKKAPDLLFQTILFGTSKMDLVAQY